MARNYNPELGEPLIKLEGYPANIKEQPIMRDANGNPIDKRKRGRPVGSKDSRPRRHNPTPTSMDANHVATMYAVGVPRNKISQLLDLSKHAVTEILNKPEVKEFALKVREVIRVSSLVNIQQVSQDAYNWLSDIASKQTDAKSFDYLTRGLAALEKVASSTSGENQKVSAQIEHTVSGDLSEEAKLLVKALIGPTNEPTSKPG